MRCLQLIIEPTIFSGTFKTSRCRGNRNKQTNDRKTIDETVNFQVA
jgi:hypothetical protein